MTFQEWMLQVDRIIDMNCGLSYEDLPDQPFKDWFDGGVSPKTAATRAMRYIMA